MAIILTRAKNGRPLKPLRSAPLEVWEAYKKELAKWKVDNEKKKQLINEINQTQPRKKRRN